MCSTSTVLNLFSPAEVPTLWAIIGENGFVNPLIVTIGIALLTFKVF